ncbi:YgjP family zinc-dependent metalloprotease [[Mycoplasma] imitans]|uniref:YgjP family zinc-dependent metalloprotease n=1 Tax=[Mycoplasma] imitans TaxID=29560 RepID=UPI000564548D|nr:SprT family zinc-dependent metalloprotease [[Mycoplasma] imitans]
MARKIKTINKILMIAGFKVNVTKKQGVKNVYLKVKPPLGDIFVSCSYNSSDQAIIDFVLSKHNFLIKARRSVLSNSKQFYNNFETGEEIYLWGEKFSLMIIDTKGRPKIEIQDNCILFNVDKNLHKNVKAKIFDNWSRKSLMYEMNKLIDGLEATIGVKANEYRIKNMKTKWGTCNVDKKRIWISLRLVKKPLVCLLYVLIHEMVHLIEQNHTKKFYKIVEQFLPNWKEINKLLKK